MLLSVIAVSVVVIDQLSKALIVSTIGPAAPEARIDIVGTWIALEYAENRGAAFGLLAGLGPFLVLGPVAIVVVLLLHVWRNTDLPLWQSMAIGAIVGGAVGNLIDRLRWGYVIDYVAIGAWPNFNVADSAITFGAALAIWGWLFAHEEQGAALRR